MIRLSRILSLHFATLTRLAAGTTAALALASGAQAQTGTVTVTGTVTASTCSGTPSGTIVPLPTVSTSSLASAGATAGYTAFTLSFTGCTISVATAPYLYFDPSANSVTVNNNLTFGGNVEIQLMRVNAGVPSALNLGAAAGSQGMTPASSVSVGSGKSFSFPMAARYYANAAATAFSGSATASYTVVYP